MDIIAISPNNYKVKGKTVSATVSADQVVLEPIGADAFTISEPGEYEVGGISVLAFEGSFVLEVDNLRIFFLGSEKPGDSVISEAGAIDIAVSVNVDVAKAVDPWIAVTTTSVASVEPLPKLSTTSDKLPLDLQVVVLATK